MWYVIMVFAVLFLIAEVVLRFKDRLKSRPDLTIMANDLPYMHRWYLIPRNHWFNIYLHNMVADDDAIMHDHPWWNVSVILKGGYLEWRSLPSMGDRAIDVKWQAPGFVIFRKATQAHRLTLGSRPYRTCWSLFITGRNVRKWGFHCPQGWKPFDDYLRDRAVKGSKQINQGGC